jgi:hypothetical protein
MEITEPELHGSSRRACWTRPARSTRCCFVPTKASVIPIACRLFRGKPMLYVTRVDKLISVEKKELAIRLCGKAMLYIGKPMV